MFGAVLYPDNLFQIAISRSYDTISSQWPMARKDHPRFPSWLAKVGPFSRGP